MSDLVIGNLAGGVQSLDALLGNLPLLIVLPIGPGEVSNQSEPNLLDDI